MTLTVYQITHMYIQKMYML